MPRRHPIPFDDPRYPHGTDVGYQSGCHRDSPCPATPPCATVHAEAHAAYMVRRRAAATDLIGTGRIVAQVKIRARRLLEVTPVDQVATYLNVTPEQILEFVADATLGTRTVHPLAADLDRAWAWFVKGSDLTGVTKHGHYTYDKQWCRCVVCTEAACKEKKRWTAGIKKAEYEFVVDPAVSDRVNALIAAAGNINQVAKIVGYHHAGVTRIARNPKHPVRVDVRARIMRWDPTTIDGHRSDGTPVDNARVLLMVGQMNALGYPNFWINRRANVTRSRTHQFTRTPQVQLRIERGIAAVHAQVGDRPATEADGLTTKTIKRTKKRAKKAGVYPPIYYDEDGTLDYRAVPNHPWTMTENKCGPDVDYARTLAKGESQAAAARRLGRFDDTETAKHAKAIGRVSKRIGFVYTDGGEFDHAANRAKASRVLDVCWAYEAGQIGPVFASLLLGTRDVDSLSQRHPDVALFRAARTLAWVWATQSRIDRLVACHTPPSVDRRAA